MSLFYLTLVCVIGSLIYVLALILQHKHLLSILSSLEAMTVSLFIILFLLINNIALVGESSFIFITFWGLWG